MRVEEFYQNRKQDWNALAQLVARSQRALAQLSPGEIQDLARLYRNATSDLALAQRDFARHPVVDYLNQLVGRAHAAIYRNEPMAVNRLVRFATGGFPRLFRSMFTFVLAAALMLVVPALLAAVSTALAPQSAVWLLPADVQELIPGIESQELWLDIPVSERPYASSFIMQNNIRVSFLAFSSGITGGIFTLYVLAFNGLILGGLTGLTAHYGVGLELWTFVIGHGVIELSVIVMAGGAGLRIGWALLRPGLMRRRDALAQAARQAVYLLVGAVPLLMIAGTIEGLISPADNVPWPVKWGIGIGSGLALYSYLAFAGRGKDGPGAHKSLRPLSSR
jgi:uncharacterized membrane protein SpoIIM required for sporulation